jgi:hypothetical protein
MSDAVHVVGQHHPGIDMERALVPRLTYCIAQTVDMPDQGILPPLQQVYGKKVSAAGHTVSAVIRHDPPVPNQNNPSIKKRRP